MKLTYIAYALVAATCIIALYDNVLRAGPIQPVHSLNGFNEKIKRGNVIVKFSAEWCGPCHSFAPTFARAAEQFPDITFVNIDISHQREIAATYHVQSVPTVIYFKDGVEVERTSGALPYKLLEETIRATYQRA